MENSKVFVVILNYQSYQDTIAYVNCLQKQEQVDLNIIIVDNCSPNNSFCILETKYLDNQNVEVIKSHRNGGYAYGNNFGLRFVKDRIFDFMVISNNDIEISDNQLIYKMILEYNQLSNPAFVSPLMFENNILSKYPAWRIPTLISDLKASLRTLYLILPNYDTYKIPEIGTIMEVDCVPGSFFLSKKSVIYDIGLFDEETFLYMEEAILGFKAKHFGLRNYLLTTLFFNHKTSKTISSELSQRKMRKHLIESRIFFHKSYLHTSKFGLLLLSLTFKLWEIETFIISIFNSKKSKADDK